MRDIVSFIKLEMMSVKSSLSMKTLFLFGALIVVGYMSMGITGIAVGAVPIIVNIASYPFAVGENGLDRLFASLSLPRRTVVMGRYIFAILLALAVSLVYLGVGHILFSIDQMPSLTPLLIVVAGTFVISTFLIAINLPVLFKVGFKKAKFFSSMLPIFMVLALAVASNLQGDSGENIIASIFGFFSRMMSGDGFIYDVLIPTGLIFTWVAAILASLLISHKLYDSRDF